MDTHTISPNLIDDSKVKLIHITPDAERHTAYCARVSSPNQDNPEFEKLIKYLIKHKHWSPFEMANICLEIQTSRAISPQILRHRSFQFQEFSQRYSEVSDYEVYDARRQDNKNKQNSIDDMNEDDKIWFKNAQQDINELAFNLYKQALNRGVAKELARVLLPLGASTKLYMNGSIRSWIHYIEVRGDNSTQLEHRNIALQAKAILSKELPTIAKALGWK